MSARSPGGCAPRDEVRRSEAPQRSHEDGDRVTTSPPVTTDAFVNEVLTGPVAVRVNGQPAGSPARQMPVVSPIDGAAFAEVGVGAARDAQHAVEVAVTIGRDWASTEVPDRAQALRAIAADLDAAAHDSADAEAWARLVSRETGKRLPEAQAELGLSATYFRTFADLVEEGTDTSHELVPGLQHRVSARPLGVAAVLTPWNFPVSIPARKIAPALGAGCTVVFKPSELAPLSSMVLAAIVDRHVPAGVVNTVLGEPSEVVGPWLAHDDVRVLSFTGSTRVGRILASATSPRFLRTVMELGGCAPAVVLPDADPESAVRTLAIAKFRNNGQSCIAANQIFLAREVANDVIAGLAETVESMNVGDPLDPDTGLGPVAPVGDPERLRGLVNEAVGAGARAVAQGGSIPQRGHYVEPTVLTDVPATARVFTEEIFGPIAAVRVYDDLDTVLAEHLATGYGLAGYVCGSDTERAAEVAAQLRAGIIGINTGTPNHPRIPFGGLGLSGLGYEGGHQGLDVFSSFHTTTVADS